MPSILPDTVPNVLIASFAAGPLAANCYLLAAGPAAPCVVVDPGMAALEPLVDLLGQHRLHPAAVLLTHGHFDHVADAAAVADRWSVPCWVHPDDRFMLADPLAAVPAAMHPLLVPPNGPAPVFTEPAKVRTYTGGERLPIAGLEFEVIAAPGHTAGSVLLCTSYPDDPAVEAVVLTGDVVFAGTIGRTDLPGGNHPEMLDSLRRHVLALPDAVALLPGHGPQTTVGRERATNPYLVQLGDGLNGGASFPAGA